MGHPACLSASDQFRLHCRDSWDQCREQAGELFFCAAAYFHDVLVVDGIGSLLPGGDDSGGHVGDEGYTEDFEAHVAGDDGFVDGGHAYEVGAEGLEGADFGGSFEGGAEDGEVDALRKWKVLAGGLFEGQGAEARRVGGGHVEEPLAGPQGHAETRFVWATSGIDSGEIDMVGDGDQSAWSVTRVDASGSVGDDEGFATEETEDACRKGDLGDRVALVGVDAALHDGYGDTCDGSEDEISGVALYGGAGKVGDFGVGDAGGVLDLSCEVAEAGAEDDADAGVGVGGDADVVGGGLSVAIKVSHDLVLP
jgi:hypothetical protein